MQAYLLHRRRPVFARTLTLFMTLTLLSAVLPMAQTVAAAPLPPPNFQVTPVFTGLKNPTDFAFADDGRVFVAEKAGLVKVFDSLSDPTPTVFADLQTNVYKGPNDHGILGLTLDPQFTASRPYVYVLYTYDAPIGGTAPRWNDVCNDPPGAGINGCVVSGRLSRLQANGNQMTGAEQVLVEAWCQQSTSHSIGELAFGADGALYASAGEGANTSSGDYGHLGITGVISPGTPFEKDYTPYPINPCGDPPVAIGERQTRPTARGGALRSQSLRRPAGEPRLLSGTIIRVDPNTGAGMPDNPRHSSADANERRVVAHGLRNPFRFTIRPGTNDIWIGDVGWGRTEEIDRVASPTAATVANFGWPCYEGAERQAAYDGMNLDMCEQLYAEANAVAAPYYAYAHRASMIPGDTCSDAHACTSAISGLAFYNGGPYPGAYSGALFFADYARHGIWAMRKGANGLPDPATVAPFITNAGYPVSLKVGPDGDLFYADISGTIFRVQYFGGNQPPVANIQADRTSGALPLTVHFDGRDSSDADGDPLTYAWDLDGDGQYDDSILATPTYTYTQEGTYIAQLKVTDDVGASRSASKTISPGNTPPTAVIDTPSAGMKWRVGDVIAFAGHAADAEQGTLPAAALAWTIVLHHCYSPSNCHEHLVEEIDGAGGTFTTPDHEDLPYIELRLTATDAGGLSDTASVLLSPRTTTLALRSNPSSLAITLDSDDISTPHDRTVVAGSAHTLIAPAIQAHRSFLAWADTNTQTLRTVLIGTTPSTYTAAYANRPPLARASATASSGVAPLTVAFSAAQSSDPEGDALSYRWEFGDGATATIPSPTHTYTTP
ncbi:MAG: PKD domain-containing protein, partial [Roseiflexaceae bacterium]